MSIRWRNKIEALVFEVENNKKAKEQAEQRIMYMEKVIEERSLKDQRDQFESEEEDLKKQVEVLENSESFDEGKSLLFHPLFVNN